MRTGVVLVIAIGETIRGGAHRIPTAETFFAVVAAIRTVAAAIESIFAGELPWAFILVVASHEPLAIAAENALAAETVLSIECFLAIGVVATTIGETASATLTTPSGILFAIESALTGHPLAVPQAPFVRRHFVVTGIAFIFIRETIRFAIAELFVALATIPTAELFAIAAETALAIETAVAFVIRESVVVGEAVMRPISELTIFTAVPKGCRA